MLKMNAAAETALRQAFSEINVDPADCGGGVSIEGEEPEGLSPHWLATAGSVALALKGACINSVWRQRSGKRQTVSVSMNDAMHALGSHAYVRQNGNAQDPNKINKTLVGYFRTADDRWVMFPAHHNYSQHLDALLDILDCAYTTPRCVEAIAKWRGEDLEDAMAARNAPCSVARTREEWLAHPQGQWLAGRPVVEIEKIADSAPEPFPPGARPLSRLRVLDMTHVVGGPIMCRSMAEQGAEVLHITDAGHPDTPWTYLDTMLGKRSAHLNLKNSVHQGRLRELAGQADVFAQSWRPGVLDKYGASPADLAKLRPGIIYVSISCYGMGGPWAGRGGFDPNAQAVTGVAITEGDGGAPRAVVTATVNDYLVAWFGAAGALAALLRRAREGGSYHVKVSLSGTSMWLQRFGLKPGWTGRPAPSDLPLAKAPPKFIMTKSALGEIRNLAPALQYSETPAYWARPMEPFGASYPEWLPR